MSGVICDRRVPARVKGKMYKVAVRPGNVVRVGDSSTDEKTGGRDGGGRVEDVAIFIRSDKNGQDQELSTSEGQHRWERLERKLERQD